MDRVVARHVLLLAITYIELGGFVGFALLMWNIIPLVRVPFIVGMFLSDGSGLFPAPYIIGLGQDQNLVDDLVVVYFTLHNC